jgi:hypothetical protein
MSSRRPKLGDMIVTEASIEQKAAAKLAESGLAYISPTVTNPSLEREKEISGENEPQSGSSYVLYEAMVDGKARYYPAATTTPRAGKFYGIRTVEDNNRSRIFISHKDYNESFPFSEGPILTKYGIGTGKTCNITLKLVDVMIDVNREQILGVYLVVMTPSFAQIDVDAVRLVRELEQKDISRIKEETLTHEALMLKFQLEEALKQSETYRRALFDRDTNITKLAEDFAAPIIERTISALTSAGDMFDEYYRQKSGSIYLLKKHWKKLVAVAGIIIGGLLLYLFGPW